MGGMQGWHDGAKKIFKKFVFVQAIPFIFTALKSTRYEKTNPPPAGERTMR
jgi:hypothetical protein